MPARLFLPSLLFLCSIVAGCSSDSVPVTPGEPPLDSLAVVATATSGGIRADLMSTRAPEIGMAQFRIVLTDESTGKRIRTGTLAAIPTMIMPGAPHTAPCEAPTGVDTAGTWPMTVVLTMTGEWVLKTTWIGEGRAPVVMDLRFTTAATTHVKAVIGSDGEIYIVTLAQPLNPEIGLNDCHVLIHRQVRSDLYVPVEDATVDMEPFMPGMGHGSPGNVDPIHTGLGHYLGRVSFTMSGDWRINLSITRPDPVNETLPIRITTFFPIQL